MSINSAASLSCDPADRVIAHSMILILELVAADGQRVALKLNAIGAQRNVAAGSNSMSAETRDCDNDLGETADGRDRKPSANRHPNDSRSLSSHTALASHLVAPALRASLVGRISRSSQPLPQGIEHPVRPNRYHSIFVHSSRALTSAVMRTCLCSSRSLHDRAQ